MQVIPTIPALRTALAEAHADGKSIGLVPTMGALHAGHASLVERSTRENELTVVSVFVNPTQFNDPTDLANYPRTLEADCYLLEQLGADYVFAPTAAEMYPEPDTRTFSYPPTDTVMEGAFRPGHFNGVCQIVSKLFEIVEPTRAYFGEKDYQQVAVIRRMVADKGYPLTIVPCPIVREADGLALSSRNSLLTPDERTTALAISRALRESLAYAKEHTLSDTRQWVVEQVNATPGLQVQYYEIVDGLSLCSLNAWEDSPQPVGCITVFCGQRPVRLIDNIQYA